MKIQPIELVGAAWTAFAAYWLVEGVKANRAETRESAGQRFAHVLLMATAFYLVAISDPRLGRLNERFMGERRWVTDLGVALAFPGVGFAIWARHHIGRYWSARVSILTEHKLVSTGPYGRIRHPIYTGILVALAGTALVVGEYRALVGLDHVGTDRIHDHLHQYARDLPELGTRPLTLPARPMGKYPRPSKHKSRPRRSIRVRIAAGPITIKAPKPAHGESHEKQLDLWVIHVKEATAPPAGEDPVEWVLLSNVAVSNFAQACERVDWYGCRWVIEEFHKAIKSGGCNVQELQLREESRLEPMIAILSVTAAVLMELRHLARDPQTQNQPARQVVPVSYVKSLSVWRNRVVNPEMSCYDFCLALARLGGHLNRKSDGFPGWQTLWRGWEELQIMTAAVEAMDEARRSWRRSSNSRLFEY